MAAAPDEVFEVFSRGVQALKALDAAFCLVGGLARGFYAEPRGTKDVDFAIAAESDARVDELLRGLRFEGFREHEMFFHKKTRALATARFTLGDDNTRMDLLFATSGIEASVVEHAVEKKISSGVVVPVVSLAHLIAMKCIAGRPQDLADIAVLLPAASPEEVDEVPALIALAPAEKKVRGLEAWRFASEAAQKFSADLTASSPSRRRRKPVR